MTVAVHFVLSSEEGPHSTCHGFLTTDFDNRFGGKLLFIHGCGKNKGKKNRDVISLKKFVKMK
jgi:hypothetical protein